MKQMSEYVSKLEGYADLEVAIIRATKINKVLKAVLKLNNIPKEEEFQFKPRSQSLLDKWNKLLAGESSTSADGAATNGVGDESKLEVDEVKTTHAEKTNGVKEEAKAEEKSADLETPITESKDKAASEEALDTPVEDTPKVCKNKNKTYILSIATNQTIGIISRPGHRRSNSIIGIFT